MRAARPLLIAAVLITALAAAAGAQAAVIGGSLTLTPPGGTFPAYYNVDSAVPPAEHQATLAGNVVTDGGGASTVDLGCYTASRAGILSSGSMASAVPLDVAGIFSTTVDGTSLSAPCLMGILLGGPGVMPPSQVVGSALYTAIIRRTTRAIGGPNAGAIKSTTISSAGLQGGSTIGDPDNGTPLDLSPVESVLGTPSPRQSAWNQGGEILDAANLPGTRSSVTVDGKNAYTSGEEAAINDSLPGLKGLTIDHFSHLGNAVSVTMTEPFLTCPAPCSAYQDAGIALRRTAETNTANRVMTVTDEWLSTDGRPHALDILFQYEAGGGTPEFGLPWIDGGAFKTYTGGTVAPPPGRVSTIYEHNTVGDPGDTSGTLTLSARPASMKFTGNNSFQLQFLRSLPATGAVTIVSTYTASTGAFDSGSVASAEAAANASGPRVAITSASSATGNPAFTVTGTASSQAGVTSVAVNGAAATVAADGTWSAPLTLIAGANPVSAVVTDGDGETATAAASVTFTPTLGPVASAAVAAFGAKPVFKKGVLTLNLGCQGQPGQVCSIGVLLTSGVVKAAAKGKAKVVTLLKKTVQVPAGAVHPVKLKLSRAALKRIPKGRALTAKLALSQAVAGKATTKRYTLKLRR